ncbi:MAG: flavodoxin [Lentisphaeria bacterium]|nr:flavodoxin [Lentisphaeria bacterium]
MNRKKFTALSIGATAFAANPIAAEPAATENKESNVLIAYYSRRGENYVNGSIKELKLGNTEGIAGKIQQLAGGTLFQIETVKPYPKNYRETTRVAQKELQDKARPELSGKVEDMRRYDIVFLGYPNWWGTMPMAVLTFLESCDFKGKTVIPFCTHEGSGLGRSERDLARALPGVTLLPGLEVRGSTVNDASVDAKVRQWVETSLKK